jgi:hypothetical protein
MIMVAKRMAPPERPASPVVFMACVPMVMGNANSLTYAPITMANTRTACWTRVMLWATEMHRTNLIFVRVYRHQRFPTTPELRRHMAIWLRYRPEAPRTRKMAWLRRYGCRVDRGEFISIKIGIVHE